MKLPFKFQDIHACEAAVLTCIDFRFWRETVEFIEKELNIKSFDFPSLPGAAKAINECAGADDLAMRCVGVPCQLHQVKKIVVINHWDCGAYGGSKNFPSREAEQSFHESELKKAGEKIKQFYPDKEIILALAKLSEDNQNIEFVLLSEAEALTIS